MDPNWKTKKVGLGQVRYSWLFLQELIALVAYRGPRIHRAQHEQNLNKRNTKQRDRRYLELRNGAGHENLLCQSRTTVKLSVTMSPWVRGRFRIGNGAWTRTPGGGTKDRIIVLFVFCSFLFPFRSDEHLVHDSLFALGATVPFFFSVFACSLVFLRPRAGPRGRSREDGFVVTGVFSRPKQAQVLLLPSWTTTPWWVVRAHARVVRAHARVVRAHARVVRAHTRVGDRVLGGDSSQVGEQLAPADPINSACLCCHPGGSVVTSVFSRSKQVQALPGRRLRGGWSCPGGAGSRPGGSGSRPGGSGSCPGGAGSHLT